jgi:hypothetical protein
MSSSAKRPCASVAPAEGVAVPCPAATLAPSSGKPTCASNTVPARPALPAAPAAPCADSARSAIAVM